MFIFKLQWWVPLKKGATISGFLSEQTEVQFGRS
jgi:hypothetical protein